jgi:HK97 family phage major capsid protein
MNPDQIARANRAAETAVMEYRSYIADLPERPSASQMEEATRLELRAMQARQTATMEIEDAEKRARTGAAHARLGDAVGGRTESRTLAAAAEIRSLEEWAPESRIGDSIELRSLSISGGTSTGADTVPVRVGGLITPEVYTANLEQLVRRVVTSNGEPTKHPRRATFQAMAPIAELATYAKSNGSFATVSTTPQKFGAISQASLELLQDSATDIASVVLGGFEDSWALTVEAAVVAGTNVTGDGILGEDAATTTAAVDAVTADEILHHFYSGGMNAAYRNRAVWMFNSTTIEAIRKLKDADDNYLVAGLTEGMPRLLGRPVLEVPSMPDIEAGAKFGALVDPTAVILHVVRGLTVTRSDEYAWDEDLASWKGTVRADAVVADPNGVAVIANAAA